MPDLYLLDTNIIAAYFNQESEVISRVNESSVFRCAIVVGELFYGAYNSGRSTANIARLEDFESSNAGIDCDAQTAQIYGNLKKDLHKKGRPISENDIWIAAIALQHNLVLATRDAHFGAVNGLKLELW